jgi:hypothetical protein
VNEKGERRGRNYEYEGMGKYIKGTSEEYERKEGRR